MAKRPTANASATRKKDRVDKNMEKSPRSGGLITRFGQCDVIEGRKQPLTAVKPRRRNRARRWNHEVPKEKWRPGRGSGSSHSRPQSLEVLEASPRMERGGRR